MYLALVPQSSRFRRLVRSWKYADQKREHQKRLDEMYRNIPPEMRSRYAYVQQVAAAIRANYSQLSYASQIFATQMEAKLDGAAGRLRAAAATPRTRIASTCKSLNPDQVRSEVGVSGTIAGQGAGEGAGDQPAAHRDPAEAGGEVREDPGELAR